MTTTSVAHRMGIFDRVARSIEIRTRGAVPHAFLTVFVISMLTAAVFNNDAAILLLTPIVAPLIRHLYPKRPYLVLPFSFAVFIAAGVAPFSTSNPMNLVVAERAGIGFNGYAARMIPVSLIAAFVSYRMARIAFRDKLEDDIPARGAERGSLAPMQDESKGVLAVVLGLLLAYPVVSFFNGPVWAVAVAGAVFTILLGFKQRALRPGDLVDGVAWDVLAFLFFIFALAMGLRNQGLVDQLVRVYSVAHGNRFQEISVVGGVSALGSAVLNNHPMAALNALAVGSVPGDPHWRTLAALVGGDLGPRLLPIGSLAGLLWLEMLRRLEIEVGVKDFIRVGFLTTIPALVASLFTLWIESLFF